MLLGQHASLSRRAILQKRMPTVLLVLQQGPYLEELVELSTWPEFEPYVPDILNPSVNILRAENADNSGVAIKIISNLVQYHKKTLSLNLNALLPLIPEALGKLPGIAARLNNRLSPPPPKNTLSDTARLAVLSGFADLALSIFKAYNHVASEVAQYLPPIISVLKCQVRAPDEARGDAVANEAMFIKVQVKAMSILAYLVQVSYESDNLSGLESFEDFWELLPGITVRLLDNCPYTIRNALFSATNDIIVFNFRKRFLSTIPALLCEKTLIGDSLVIYETSRPRAYSVVGELIGPLSEDLRPDTIHDVVYYNLPKILDDVPGTSLQSLSLKLVKRIATPITKGFNAVAARFYLMAILSTIAYRIEFINITSMGMQRSQQSQSGVFMSRPIQTMKTAAITPNPQEMTRTLLKELMSALGEILKTFKTLTTDSDGLSLEEDHTIRRLKEEVLKSKDIADSTLLGEVITIIDSLPHQQSIEEVILDIGILTNAVSPEDIIKLLERFATGKWHITAMNFDTLRRMVENLQDSPSTSQLCKYMAMFHLEQILSQWLQRAPGGKKDELMGSILSLLDSVATGRLKGLPNLRMIIHNGIARRPDAFKNSVIVQCFPKSDVNPGTRWLIFRDIINPTMAMLVRRHWQDGSATLAPDAIESLILYVQEQYSSGRPSKPIVDHTAVEILSLFAMLIEYCPEYVEHLYPIIINFSLAFDGQDVFLKYAGLNVIARCIARNKTTPELTESTFRLLLENGPDECAPMIREGLRFILPVLFKRCQKRRKEIWIAMSQALTASSNSDIHRKTLLEAVVSEPALFRHAPEQLAGPMIDCLRQATLLSSHISLSRDLALRVLTLLHEGLIRRRGRWRLWQRRGERENVLIPKLLYCLIVFTIQQDSAKHSTERHDAAMILVCDVIKRHWANIDSAVQDSLQKMLTSGVMQAGLAPTGSEIFVRTQINKYRTRLGILLQIVDVESREYISRNKRVFKTIISMAITPQRPEIQALARTVEHNKFAAQVQQEHGVPRMNEKMNEGREVPQARGLLGTILGWFVPGRNTRQPEGTSQELAHRAVFTEKA